MNDLYAVISALLASWFLWRWLGQTHLGHIPTIGTSVPVLSYIQSLQFFKRAGEFIQEGYNKHAYNGGVFKVAMPDQWLVVIAGPTMIEEMRRLPEDIASLLGGGDQSLATRHVVGTRVAEDPDRMAFVRARVGRNIPENFNMLQEELTTALSSVIGFPDGSLFPSRDQQLLSVFTQFARDYTISRRLIIMFPNILKPIVSRVFNRTHGSVRAAYTLLAPAIRERRQKAEECLKTGRVWHDKPNDMLMWAIERAVQEGRPDESVVPSLLFAEYSTVRVEAMNFTQALFRLSANPQYIASLREEVEEALAANNGRWNKTVVTMLSKMDSFLKESFRLSGVTHTSMWRQTQKPVTFSNGTTIPSGVFVAAAAAATHIDGNLYPNPHTFDPWRFVGCVGQNSLATTRPDFLPFGHGRHACPGRHFATYQMKLLLAYIVTKYDLAMDPRLEGKLPQSITFGTFIFPNPSVRVMMRRRVHYWTSRRWE
ncbi:hypothetical protein EIP91_007969 [Steccherinum ochraceum]|uniref:Cytochrome P450 n=1 Tax=Steccherinum ochraceum TaxID=92696 RepID=A0A4V2MVB7_9APHY|nr:hypothetical protein EIP91_007969 [Steccherinum ochraceum]